MWMAAAFLHGAPTEAPVARVAPSYQLPDAQRLANFLTTWD